MSTDKGFTLVSDLKYGADTSQRGNLYIPEDSVEGTICLFHGGFWKMPYGLDQFDQVCELLVTHGFIVWNIEYRRTGIPNRFWFDTFEDAIKSVNHLKVLKETYDRIDMNQVIFMGHSAGGHLALWLSNNNGIVTEEKLEIVPISTIGLAPIVDLIESHNNKAGGDSVEMLLQCTPTENIKRYIDTSPIELLPLKNPTIILHGDCDEYLSIETVRDFRKKNDSLNSNCILFEVSDGHHMDFIDPLSKSSQNLIDVLKDIVKNKCDL